MTEDPESLPSRAVIAALRRQPAPRPALLETALACLVLAAIVVLFVWLAGNGCGDIQ